MACLLFAFVLEGWSTLAAFKEFKVAKGKLGWFEAIRESKDPPAFIVLLENGAAMAGIVAAAIGLFAGADDRQPILRRRRVGRHRDDPRRDRVPARL